MSEKKFTSKNRFTSLKKYTIPETPLNQTISEDRQKPYIQPTDQKSICQKYLNVYESIKRKEGSQIIQRFQNTVSKQKKSALKAKEIFQNSLIQNSYPKNKNQQKQVKLPENHIKEQNNANNDNVQIYFERIKKIPSKKNELALKMITENKHYSQQKQNQEQKQENMIVKGNQIMEGQAILFLDRSNMNRNDNNSSQRRNTNFKKQTIFKKPNPLPYSYWQTNTFIGTNVNKAYSGYYKAKNKKKYDKERQKCIRNSTTFIKQIDKSIQNQKYRQLVIRPKTCHIKSRNTCKQFDFSLVCSDMAKFCEFGIQQKMIRTQSEAKLNNFQKDNSSNTFKKINYFGLIRKTKAKTPNQVGFLFNGKQSNDFERKNYKKYTFHSKMPLKNHSYHPSDLLNSDNNLMLGVTTQSALKEIIFSSYQHEQHSGYDNHNNYLQSKKTLQKKYLNNGNQRIFHQRQSSNHSSYEVSRRTRREQLTLNKIQDTIQNGVQLRIQQISYPK